MTSESTKTTSDLVLELINLTLSKLDKKSDKTKLKNVTQDLLSRSDGKLEVFKLFENNILDNNQKRCC